jgi:hypothetical protein
MAGTFYVDFVAGDSGDGLSGTPYSNLIYALSQRTSEAGAVVLKCRGTSNTSWDHGAPIDITGHSFSTLVIEPDTGYEWTGDDPPITIWNDNANEDTIDIAMNGVTIRGFRIEARRTGSGEQPAIRFGSGISDDSVVVENCKIFANGVACSGEIGDNNYATVRNCLLANYADDDSTGAAVSASFSNMRLHHCVIAAGGGVGYSQSATGSNTNSQVVNCIFLDYSDAITETPGTVSNNATFESSDPGDLGSSPVLNVVAGNFESAAITNPRTGGSDFRLASGNTNLNDEGVTGYATTDAFGTTYLDPPPIGYHQPSSGTTITVPTGPWR